jgi:hypothetical protein
MSISPFFDRNSALLRLVVFGVAGLAWPFRFLLGSCRLDKDVLNVEMPGPACDPHHANMSENSDRFDLGSSGESGTPSISNAHAHPRPPETSQNLPSRSPQAQSPLHLGHRQARPLQVPGARSAPSSPITWSCAQEKCAPVSASAISRSIQKKPARSTPLTTSAFTATNPISSPWIQKPSSKKLSNSSPATATSKKAWASWPLPGAGLPRSSLEPPSASLGKSSLIPPSSSTDNSKLGKPPAPASSHIPSQSSATPRNLSRPSTPSGRPSAPSTYPGNPATSAAPTAPSVATASNPKTRPTISSSPKSSATNSWDQMPACLSGRVIRIFTFDSPETSLLGSKGYSTTHYSGRESLRGSPAPYQRSGKERSG